jgi:restriction system protein
MILRYPHIFSPTDVLPHLGWPFVAMILLGVAVGIITWWLDRRFPALVRRWLSREKIGNALHAIVANAGGKSTIDELSWREFEQLVGESFRQRGFSVRETGGGGADGGVDIVLSRGTDRYFVQCKQWKARQVGVVPVRELYGVMTAGNAAGGYVVTSGVFTDEARRFAEGREIELIAGDQLVEMIRSAQNVSKLAPNKSDAPICPQCGSGMVLKTARKGTFAGKPFWGCSTFPNCRGTRPV